MQTLTMQEIEHVSGGRIDVGTAMKITVGLMALGAGSAIVLGVGAVALITYAALPR